MKKLFFFLSLALAVVLTGCKKGNYIDDVDPNPPENTSDENVIYTIYQKTKSLCGMKMDDAIAGLLEMDLQKMSETNFYLDAKDYGVNFFLIDEDEDEIVDILAVSIAPSTEKEHKVILTRKTVCEFAKQVGQEDKMLASSAPCLFYGYYDAVGNKVMSGDGFEDFVEGRLEVEHMNAGMALWLDENIKEFDPSEVKEPKPFTGMCLNTIQMMDGDEPLDEYTVNISFVDGETLN